MQNLKQDLWYNTSGKNWFGALPIGNGRMGGMVYGGIKCERIDLSEVTCYSGRVENANNPNAKRAFSLAKKAMLERDYETAAKYAEDITGSRENYGTNLPLGTLYLDFEHDQEETCNYKRGLNFETATTTTSYEHKGVCYTRQCFASNIHNVIVVKITANKANSINFKAFFDGGKNPNYVKVEGDTLILRGKAFETRHTKEQCGVKYCEMVKINIDGGWVEDEGWNLKVKNANSAIVYIVIRSNYEKQIPVLACEIDLELVKNKSVESIYDEHVTDFSSYYNRAEFELKNKIDYHYLPTNERLEQVKNGVEDLSLYTTMFDYARYLLISSSRENSPLPTHLQGVWNDNVACRIGWTCDMHLDINTQMNYWHAHSTNLAECTQPLSNWVHNCLLPSGKISAKQSYNCDGFVAHTVSNPWGFTAPGAAVYWGFHVTGGAWIATHLWQHYAYTLDEEFLHDTAYEVLKQACVFFTQYMVKDPQTGYYVTPLSHSPENNYRINGKEYSIALMPTCDIAILTEVFENFLNANEIIKGDEELVQKVKELKENMPPYQIGKDGRLQEWLEEFEECQPNHRHTTHMLGLHPFGSITPEKTPELAKACEKSMQARMTPYELWEDTGWARSMLMAYSARLWDGEGAWFHVQEMLKRITQKNLFVIHPPTAGATSDVYELDGNTGLGSCLAEMLLQSYDETIHLLPALPKAWQEGHVTGLKAKNNHTVDIYFKDNKLYKAVIKTRKGTSVNVRYNGKTIAKIADAKGEITLTLSEVLS